MKAKKLLAVVIPVIVLLGIAAAAFYLKPGQTKLNYSAPEKIVSEKVSQGADIVVNLPDETEIAGAEEKIKFEPEIDGKWNKGVAEKTLVFTPSKELEQGMVYQIAVPAAKGELKQFFKIVEPPKVLTVFPNADTETAVDSKITLVFNRPMIPLTTLSEAESKDIPVELTPATKGRWKWISTRTLQFTPETALVSSADYSVKTQENFTSFEGLKIEPVEHKFNTTPLRYETISTAELIYNKPINIFFNQPVNLEKTKDEINVYNKTESKDVNIVVEYGKRDKWNAVTNKYEEMIDQSVLAIYQKTDKFGRNKFWDFKTGYSIEIQKAYPLEGDIVLEEKNSSLLFSTDVVKNLTAYSDRSNYATKEFMDPKGSLEIEFYEEVDIGRTKIEIDKLKNMEYGEKCAEQAKGTEEIVWSSEDDDETECKKEQDKTKLKLTFKDNEIGLSEKLDLKINKVVNTSGIEINPDVIEDSIYFYPKFEIKNVMQDGQDAASTEDLTICTTTPLHAPLLESDDEKAVLENIDDYLKVDQDYKFRNWGESYYISTNPQKIYPKCQPYEFQTEIYYYLNPNADYGINLNLKDVFDQQLEKEVKFTTGEIGDMLKNFYHLQDQYSVTTPKATKLTFATENLDYVDMEICKVSPETLLYTLNNGIDYTSSASSQVDCEWTTEKQIDIEGNYWARNYFQVTLADYIESGMGHYIVSFTNPTYKDWDKNQMYEHASVSITNLSAIQKEIQANEYSYMTEENKLTDKQKNDLENMYWITDITTLNPVSNASVELYQFDSPDNSEQTSLVDTLSTDDKGIAKSKVYTNPAGAVIRSGNDSAVIPNYTTDVSWGETAYNTDKIYIYTDRPIYRPGDKVQIKGIYRMGYDNDMEIFRDNKMPIKIYDAEYNEVYSTELDVNQYGTFNTEFTIDSGAPLGQYRVDANMQSTSFDVQEYVGAAFKVNTKLDKEEYIAGEKFNLDVQADYYFGVPVEGGNVTYSIIAQDYYFDKYTDEWFNFGSGWYSCWWECYSNDKFILRGEKELSKTGSAQISYNLDFNKYFEDETDKKSKIFVVNMAVKNTNGQQISTQKSFIVHAGEVYLGIRMDDYGVKAGDEFELKVKSVDTQGKPKGQGNISGTLSKVTWETIRRKEVDGSFYFRTEEKLEQIDEFNLSTNSDGNYSKKLTIKNEGEYKIKLTTKDGRGNTVSSTSSVYVYKGNESSDFADDVSLVRQTNDTSLEIVNNSGLLNVGDKASFMIKNPYKKPAKALIAIERGKIFNYEIVDVDSSFYKYEFDIIDDYIPNIYASVTLLSQDPGLKYANTAFMIDVKKKDLNIEVKTDKQSYLPGEEVKAEITVKDSEGKPVETELSMAVVDMSVLALKGNPHKNPVKFFYAGFPLTVSTSANLRNLLHEIQIKPGKGGDGGDGETKKRGEFLDTAWWQAVINTDEKGYAEIKFKMPDNLTTWQIETIGVTKDTKVGVNYKELMVKKDLMITPLKPRFIIPGDTFKIGAQIFNQTDKYQDIKLTISSDTLKLDGSLETSFGLNQGESKTFYFDAKAPADIQQGKHSFTLAAKANNKEDTVEQKISITRDNTYEATATANYTSEDSASEFVFIPDNVIKDRGALRINASATLAVFISDGLNSLLDYAYGCSEQIASKLDAIATVKRGLNLENIGDKFNIKDIVFDGKTYTIDEVVKIGLARIYENQNSDGGFSYFKSWRESNYYLTLRMITTLNNVSAAGYEVNQDSITRAANYVLDKINTDKAYQSESNLIYAAHAFSSMKNNKSYLDEVAPRIKEKILSDEKMMNEDLDNMSLTYLALTMAENPDSFDSGDKDTVYKILENRVRIDARGAYMSSNKNLNWSYYESDQKITALYLKALVADKRDNTTLGNLLRWLLNSREKDGAWGSTASTLSVIDAFTDYLVWQGENKSNFDLTIALNGDELAQFKFNPETILNQEKTEISPLDKMEIGKILPLTFTKKANNSQKNNFYYDVDLKYYIPVENIAPRDEGFAISRNLYAIDDEKFENPVTEAKVGDILKGRIELIVPETRNYVAIEDYLPAGTELVNFNLATENSTVLESNYGTDEYGNECEIGAKGCNSDYYYDPSLLYARTEEMRDDRLFLFTDHLSPGTYHYDYYLRVLIPGEYNHLPAVASEMYTPEIFGRTGGEKFIVKE